MDFTKLFDVVNLSTRQLIALTIVFAVMLFSPAEFGEKLGIIDIAKDYRWLIGIGLVVSLSLLAASAIHNVFSFIFSTVNNLNSKWKLKKRLQRLTEDEKQILRFYIKKQTRSSQLRIDDGVVQGLANAGVIFISSGISKGADPEFAYNINEIAWNILNKEPSLLSGETTRP